MHEQLSLVHEAKAFQPLSDFSDTNLRCDWTSQKFGHKTMASIIASAKTRWDSLEPFFIFRVKIFSLLYSSETLLHLAVLGVTMSRSSYWFFNVFLWQRETLTSWEAFQTHQPTQSSSVLVHPRRNRSKTFVDRPKLVLNAPSRGELHIQTRIIMRINDGINVVLSSSSQSN